MNKISYYLFISKSVILKNPFSSVVQSIIIQYTYYIVHREVQNAHF